MPKKGYKLLTHEQKKEIVNSYLGTHSARETARRLGYTPQRVYYVLKRNGFEKLEKAPRGACYRNFDLVKQLAREGWSLSEIARRVGSKNQLVAKFLRCNNIPHTRFDQSGKNNPAWKGGRMLEKGKYVLIHQPDHPFANRHGYVREHRLVMEKALGRYLSSGEVVHHKNDNGLDNRLSNLEVHPSNGHHLKATLTGKPHAVSERGREKLRAIGRRLQSRRALASHT